MPSTGTSMSPPCIARMPFCTCHEFAASRRLPRAATSVVSRAGKYHSEKFDGVAVHARAVLRMELNSRGLTAGASVQR